MDISDVQGEMSDVQDGIREELVMVFGKRGGNKLALALNMSIPGLGHVDPLEDKG
jgi:hypothetical protein